jgi:hypothetical protein
MRAHQSSRTRVTKEATGKWRKLHKQELLNCVPQNVLYSDYNAPPLDYNGGNINNNNNNNNNNNSNNNNTSNNRGNSFFNLDATVCVWLTPRPRCFTPVINTSVTIVEEAGWAPWLV